MVVAEADQRIGFVTPEEAAAIEFCEFPGGYRPTRDRGDCWFDARAAQVAINFGPQFLVHTKGELGGEPLALEPWQQDIIGTLFGWKRADGTRRYRMCYLEVGRGNGKSTLCLVVAGVLVYIDDEPGAEVFSLAGTRDQSREVFGPFKINVLRNRALKSISQCYVNSITRLDSQTGLPSAVYKSVSADAPFQHGGSPHGIIFDELHVQPNRELWDVLHTGKVKRRQPLTIALTTAGYNRHSICYEQRRYAEQVRDGVIQDPEYLPVIYAASEDDDWTLPETWRKANPNMGVSVREEDLAKECQRAQDIPGYENTFKRLHLNIWTEQISRWLPMERWDVGATELPDLSGRQCYAGLDLGATSDLTALVLAFPPLTDDEPTYAKCWFWIPEEGMRNRVKRDRVPYDQWARQGFITVTEGDDVDYAIVRRDINEIAKQYSIQKLSIDRLFQGAQLAQELLNQDGLPVEEFGQGFVSMAAPSKHLEHLVITRKLVHGGNPVLRWMASNVAVEQDAAGCLKPSKKKSADKIDGIVALVMGLGELAKSATGSAEVFLI